MDDYEKKAIRSAYDLLDQATVELMGKTIPEGGRLSIVKEKIIDAMAELETTGLFERDALLKDSDLR